MYSLIDKLQPVALTENIPTVGYQTLLIQVATTGANYTGTQDEADDIISGLTVEVVDETDEDGVALNKQYIKARTIAGTKTALIEIVLTQAYIKTLTYGENITAVAKFYTTPAI